MHTISKESCIHKRFLLWINMQLPCKEFVLFLSGFCTLIISNAAYIWTTCSSSKIILLSKEGPAYNKFGFDIDALELMVHHLEKNCWTCYIKISLKVILRSFEGQAALCESWNPYAIYIIAMDWSTSGQFSNVCTCWGSR